MSVRCIVLGVASSNRLTCVMYVNVVLERKVLNFKPISQNQRPLHAPPTSRSSTQTARLRCHPSGAGKSRGISNNHHGSAHKHENKQACHSNAGEEVAGVESKVRSIMGLEYLQDECREYASHSMTLLSTRHCCYQEPETDMERIPPRETFGMLAPQFEIRQKYSCMIIYPSIRF